MRGYPPPAPSPDKVGKYPIIRGGSFYKTPLVKLTKRIAEWYPEQTQEWIGFRTVSDTAPE